MKISNNLDLLRAVAVAFVVCDHSLKFFGHPLLFGVDVQWVGKLGVMFFFVHTCLVLMMSLERSDGKFSPSAFVGNFYLRRIFRIYPLSIFAIVAVLLFAIPSAGIEGPFSISRLMPSKTLILLNVLLLQNFHEKSIIAVLWSLPFEVQMYAFLPFVYSLFARKRRLASLLLIWVIGFGLAYALRPHAVFIAHFIPGVIAYVILKRTKTPVLSAWLWPVFLGTLTIIFLVVAPSFVTGSLACLALGVASPHFREIRVRSVNAVSYNIAKYSYGVYLSHMFCLWFAFIFLRTRPMFFQSIIFLLLVVALPVILFHTVESPMIRVGTKLSDRFFVRKRSRALDLTSRAGELESTASGL